MASDLTNTADIKKLLAKYGFHFSKSLGQNFLLDAAIVEDIINAARIDEQSIVVEIGPGIGVLTKPLALKAQKIISIELDKSLLPMLQDTLAGMDNVRIINQDALKTNFDQLVRQENAGLDKRYKVVANLPYYITTPLIFHMLENHCQIEQIVIMVQKEVAERIIALPRTKNYGVLSVAVQYYTEAKIEAAVPKEVFLPQPKVDSAVLSLNIRKNPPAELLDEHLFFKVVRGAFAHRRKTLLNSLAESMSMGKEELTAILKSLNIEPARRGETLTLQEFACLSNALAGLKN